MMYREIQIPTGTEALELKWRQRITGLVPGKQSWFDARIMMEFMDAARNKASPSPGAPYARKDTEGWVERTASFLVPTNAAILKFMPSLFQAELLAVPLLAFGPLMRALAVLGMAVGTVSAWLGVGVRQTI